MIVTPLPGSYALVEERLGRQTLPSAESSALKAWPAPNW
jgi:hypothetical protein